MASDDFFINFTYFLSLHRPVILVLVETKVHGSAANVIVQKSHFNKIVAAEAIGFSGGIQILGMTLVWTWKYRV